MKLRAVALVLALGLDLLLGLRVLRPEVPALVWIHPIAPPLVHVPGAAEETILDGSGPGAAPPDAIQRGLARVVQARGTPAQREALRALDARRAALGPSFSEGHRLRAAVAADAADLVDRLGPSRVAAFLDARERLSATWAEARTWDGLAAGLAAPPAP